MSPPPTPSTLHKETLHFEKKNQTMTKLPKNAQIQKRPIPHAAPSNPYSGSTAAKTVYISTKTPFMSGVKRVQKLLRQAEKRALDALEISNPKMSDGARLAQLGERAGEEREEVFVKGTGRAIEKALSVGRWFEGRSEEYAVRVRTGSVLVVDDVVGVDEERVEEKGGEGSGLPKQSTDSASGTATTASSAQPVSRSAAKKRKRAANAPAEGGDELPETRTRWVNMVEVAVSLK